MPTGRGKITSKDYRGALTGGPPADQGAAGRADPECIEELLSFTQEKNIHVKLRPR
jgi:hypothetical protein